MTFTWVLYSPQGSYHVFLAPKLFDEGSFFTADVSDNFITIDTLTSKWPSVWSTSYICTFQDLHKIAIFQASDCTRTLEYRRSFDYYNRSRRLATAFSFRKWFPPDGSRQSERISTWFPRTVRARTFAFRATAVHSAFAVARSLKRKGNFARKTNALIRVNSQAAGKPSALFLPSLFGANRAARWKSARDPASVKATCRCEAFYFAEAPREFARKNNLCSLVHRWVHLAISKPRKSIPRINAQEQFSPALNARYLRQAITRRFANVSHFPLAEVLIALSISYCASSYAHSCLLNWTRGTNRISRGRKTLQTIPPLSCDFETI